jgi:hypothetical protein
MENNAMWSSNVSKYWATYKLLPRKHQVFLQVVLLQCLYVISERLFVMISEYNHSGRGAVWFFVVIILSLYFLFYFAFHSIMHVNVRPSFCVVGIVFGVSSRLYWSDHRPYPPLLSLLWCVMAGV